MSVVHLPLLRSLSFCLFMGLGCAASGRAQGPPTNPDLLSPSEISANFPHDLPVQSDGETELENAIKKLFVGQRTQARADLYEALELLKKSGNTTRSADAWYHIGIVEGDLGRDAQARVAFEMSRSLGRQARWPSVESYAARGLADLEEKQGNFLQARELYQQAMALARHAKDFKALANAQYTLAELEQRQGNNHAAMVKMRLSLATSKDANYKQGVVNAWAALGRFQFESGALNDAIKSYDTAARLHAPMRDRLGHAKVKLGLGNVKRLQNKPAEARRFFEDANLLYLAEQFVTGQGNAQLGLARLYAKHPHASGLRNTNASRSGPAREALIRAIDLFNSVDAGRNLASAYLELAELELSEQAYGNAAKNYAIALVHYKARQDEAGQANVLKRLGLIRAVADTANAQAESFHTRAKAQIHNNPAIAIKFWKEADQQFRKSLDAIPEQPITLTNWGIVLTNIAQQSRRAKLSAPDGFLNGALEKYDLSLQLNPNLTSTVFEKGVTLQRYADAVESTDASHADTLRRLAVTQYGQVLAQTTEVLNDEPLTGAGSKAARRSNLEAAQKWATSLLPQSRLNTAFEIRHLRFGAANNWGNILQQQAQKMVESDLPAARSLLSQSYGKFLLATQIKPPGYDALSNWAAALMAERRTLLGSEPLEAAKLLNEARRLLLSHVEEAPEILAYNLACTYAVEGRAEDAVFWLKRARLSGDAVRQSDILDDSDFDSVRGTPPFMAWLESIRNARK